MEDKKIDNFLVFVYGSLMKTDIMKNGWIKLMVNL